MSIIGFKTTLHSALIAFLLSIVFQSTALQAHSDNKELLNQIINGDHRDPNNKARDAARHPLETLMFFGVTPEMTVVEISPGGSGWYMELLAPYLRDHGKYYAASYDQSSKTDYVVRNLVAFNKKIKARPDVYDRINVTEFSPPTKVAIAPAGSADMVLTFRNVHNWVGGGSADAAFTAFYTTLKPGGILGVVEHRASNDQPQDPKAQSGYVREDYVIALAEKAGFKLIGRSEINANPKDTKDYKKGVWSLPPSLRAGDGNEQKYRDIGESDRMTLVFMKP